MLCGNRCSRRRSRARGYAGAVRLPGKRPIPGSVPAAVRGAGVLVAGEGVAALALAMVFLVRGIAGADQRVVNGLGTAALFVVIGGVVLAAGRSLAIGRLWGRGLAVVTELLLLPVAWYLAVSSHRPAFGIPAGVVALTALLLLFSPAALRWAGGQVDSASADNSAPETR